MTSQNSHLPYQTTDSPSNYIKIQMQDTSDVSHFYEVNEIYLNAHRHPDYLNVDAASPSSDTRSPRTSNSLESFATGERGDHSNINTNSTSGNRRQRLHSKSVSYDGSPHHTVPYFASDNPTVLGYPPTDSESTESLNSKRKKHVCSIEESFMQEKGDFKGIEWAYNSCFVDSVIFALYAYQDTFDSWIMQDFHQDSTDNHHINQSSSPANNPTPLEIPVSAPHEAYRSMNHSEIHQDVQNSIISLEMTHNEPIRIITPSLELEMDMVSPSPLSILDTFFGTPHSPPVNKQVEKTSDLIKNSPSGYEPVRVLSNSNLLAPGANVAASLQNAQHGSHPLHSSRSAPPIPTLDQHLDDTHKRSHSLRMDGSSSSQTHSTETFSIFPKRSHSTDSYHISEYTRSQQVDSRKEQTPMQTRQASSPSRSVSLHDLNRAQSGLRNIVNALRSKGTVPSNLVTCWRSHLYRRCGINIAFKYITSNYFKIFTHKKGSSSSKATLAAISGAELDSDLEVSTQVVFKPDYRIDYRTCFVQSSLPAMICAELYPRNKYYDVILLQELEVEYVDASELLHEVMELFQVLPNITIQSIVETDTGLHNHIERHQILFVGVPMDQPFLTLQQLINSQYCKSKELFPDSSGIRSKVTNIASVSGEGIIICLKRSSTTSSSNANPNDVQASKAKEIPVCIDVNLSITNVEYELTSVVCQYGEHYYTFAKHAAHGDSWFYFNDNVASNDGKGHSVVQPLSPAFGFAGFSKLSIAESYFQNLITVAGYIFTYRRKS